MKSVGLRKYIIPKALQLDVNCLLGWLIVNNISSIPKILNKQVQIAVHMSPVKTMEMKFTSGDEICGLSSNMCFLRQALGVESQNTRMPYHGNIAHIFGS